MYEGRDVIASTNKQFAWPRRKVDLFSSQPICFSLYASTYMLQPICFKLYASAYMFQTICFNLYASNYMLQPICFSLYASTYMLQNFYRMRFRPPIVNVCKSLQKIGAPGAIQRLAEKTIFCNTSASCMIQDAVAKNVRYDPSALQLSIGLPHGKKVRCHGGGREGGTVKGFPNTPLFFLRPHRYKLPPPLSLTPPPPGRFDVCQNFADLKILPLALLFLLLMTAACNG